MQLKLQRKKCPWDKKQVEEDGLLYQFQLVTDTPERVTVKLYICSFAFDRQFCDMSFCVIGILKTSSHIVYAPLFLFNHVTCTTGPTCTISSILGRSFRDLKNLFWKVSAFRFYSRWCFFLRCSTLPRLDCPSSPVVGSSTFKVMDSL